jgi:hypothetical protein
MVRRILSFAVAMMLVVMLTLPPPAAVACGPFFAQTIFSFRVHPDFPLTRFAAGDLGIVQPTYARSYLVVAYRYMSGKTLNTLEQESIVGLWSRHFGYSPFADNAHTNPASEWLKTRRKYAGGRDAPYIESHRRAWGTSFPGESYFYYENCQRDALRTAARTVSERAKEFGPRSESLKTWIAAQDIVFAYCGDRSETTEAELPEPLPESAPALLKADRAYQVAAIHFYAADFDTAEKEFAEIAENENSPWHVIAALLVARSRIRKATLQDSNEQAGVDLRAAEEQLHNISEKSPVPSSPYGGQASSRVHCLSAATRAAVRRACRAIELLAARYKPGRCDRGLYAVSRQAFGRHERSRR